MIKELINFTNSLDSELKAIGMTPKEGLHILLSFEEQDGQLSISNKPKSEIYSKKDKELTSAKKRFATLANLAWMVNTNKCFDLPSKGIHSCSPYCLAFKRESIRGGAKFNDAKIKLYERISAYFDKSLELLEDESEKERAKVFKFALNGEEKVHSFLDQIPEYSQLKDAEYIVFYLDINEEKYKIPNDKYLGGKLFNTEEYNELGTDNQVYGTSNFLNGFNTKKPYLKHQSASFDITGRVSANDAKTLFEFESIIGRRILPNPLPIFVYGDELKASIDLFKADALDGGNRKGHKDIIDSLLKKLSKETIGNYYLLYYERGEIKDFDFVSQFQYRLIDKNEKNFKVLDVFNEGKSYQINDVFEFQSRILPILFNNSLVVKTKGEGPLILKYFDDLEQKYCDDNNTTIYNLVMTYRGAFYDFIYKSKRKSINETMINHIVMTGIYSDLKKLNGADDSQERNRAYSIKTKLNILFSFRQFNNQSDMSSIIPALTEKTRQVINNSDVHFETNEEFAFGVGQLIYFLLNQSESSNKSHAMLEPFVLKTDVNSLKDSIRRLLIKYAYKLSLGRGRVEKLVAEIQGFTFEGNFKDLHEFMFTGYFTDCLIYEKSQKENISEI
jgi:CRISPR-associated protein Csh1